MRIFVISLGDQSERRARVAAQLNGAGVAFEFFEAISGEAAVAEQLFAAYDERNFLLDTGRHMTLGEIGCYASHRALWEYCAATDEAIVVMEDDFALLPGFVAALYTAQQFVDTLGFLRLQTDIRAKRRTLMTHGDFALSRFTKAPHALVCYCIAPAVARRFVRLSRDFETPVDVFIKKFWEHGQSLYALTPYTVCPSELHAKSTIAGRTKAQRSPVERGRRLLRKAGWLLRRAWFNLDYQLISTPDLKLFGRDSSLESRHGHASR